MERKTLALAAQARTAGHPGRDRRAGFVPAVVYGHAMEPRAIRVETAALQQLLQHGGSHHLVELVIDGEGAPRTAVIKEIQRHPVSQAVVHVDFQAVVARERITAEVPIRLHGEDRLSKAGRLLQLGLQEVRVSCLPADLPDHIVVEVGDLPAGHVVTVADLTVDPVVTLVSDPDEVIISVVLPRVSEPEAPATN